MLIMSNHIKSFADFSLKVVAVRTADNSDFEFEFPASSKQTASSVETIPMKLHPECLLDPQGVIGTWRHKGLNE